MDFNWIEEYCLSKNGTAKDYKEEWDAVRFQIGDKMYAMLGEIERGTGIHLETSA